MRLSWGVGSVCKGKGHFLARCMRLLLVCINTATVFDGFP